MTIPKSVTSIGERAFERCSSLKEVHISDVAAWCQIDFKDYTSNPLYYAQHLFINGKEIDNLSIPEGVTTIGSYAFLNCSSLTSVTIPNSVTSIGDSFYGCNSIESATINARTAGHWGGCPNLTSVVLGSEVAEIGEVVFPNSLKTLHIEVTDVSAIASLCDNYLGCGRKGQSDEIKDVEIYVPTECYNEYVSRSDKKIMPEQTEWVTDDVTVIRMQEAGELRVETVMLDDDNITFLKIVGPINADDIAYLREGKGKLANLQQLDLSEVTLVPGPSSYASIISGNDVVSVTHAFYIGEKDTITSTGHVTGLGQSVGVECHYNTSLQGAFLKSNILRIAMPSGIDEVGIYTFNNSKVMDIKTSTPIKKISDEAFKGCEILRTIDLSNTTEIGDGAFRYCSSLRSVGNLSKLRRLGGRAFAGCSELDFGEKGLRLTSLDTIQASAFYGNLKLKKVTLSNKLKTIGESAFIDCTELNDVVIPQTCTMLGGYAFYGCSSLNNISIPSTLLNVSATTFKKTPLMSADVENGICYLKHLALACDGSVSGTLTFRDGTTGIANSFLSTTNSRSVTGISLPSSLKRIGYSAFKEARIASLQLPESLQTIGREAFISALTCSSLTIPESVDSIGWYSFRNNTSLQTLNYKASSENAESYLFSGCNSLEKVTIGNKVRMIPENAFEGCTGLAVVQFDSRSDNTPLSFLYSSFRNCSNLQRITLPEFTDSIGSEAFAQCTKLKSIVIPQSVKTIGENAFYGCTGLTSVTISEGVKTINSAFGRCTGLTSVTIPASVEAMNGAFSGCTGLLSVISLIMNPSSINIDHAAAATLYVPRGTKEKYQSTYGWKSFREIIEFGPTDELIIGTEGTIVSIGDVKEKKNGVATVYDLNGRPVTGTKRGLQLQRMADGSVRKVMKQ